MRNVLDKICREYQNTHFVFKTFIRKWCRLWDNVENCGEAREATDHIIGRLRFACWISKATRKHARPDVPAQVRTFTHARTHQRACAHRNIYHLLLFHSNNSFANTPEFYVILTLPVFEVRDVTLCGFIQWLLIFRRILLAASSRCHKPKDQNANFYRLVHFI